VELSIRRLRKHPQISFVTNQREGIGKSNGHEDFRVVPIKFTTYTIRQFNLKTFVIPLSIVLYNLNYNRSST